MSRIGIFFAEGYEEVEALTVVDLARRAGLEIDMISVTRCFPKLISAGWTCWCSRAGCRGLRTWRTVRN